MSQDIITEETTIDDIIDHLDAAGVEYSTITYGEGVRAGSLLIWRHGADEGEGVANLWGWRDRDCSGGLDSFAELDSLVAGTSSAPNPQPRRKPRSRSAIWRLRR